MRSRHNGYCETCGGAIALGSVVLWSHDYGAHHTHCWHDPADVVGLDADADQPQDDSDDER